MQTPAESRTILADAAQQVYGRECGLRELQLLQAFATVETGCGTGWRIGSSGYGSNNWGAIQAGSAWTGDTFTTRDSHPTADGGSLWYSAAYRSYPSPEAGAADLLRVLGGGRHGGCLVPAAAGDVRGFAQALYDSGYYEGHGKTPKLRVYRRRWALTAALIRNCKALREPMPDGGTPPETVDDSARGYWSEIAKAFCAALGFGSIRAAQLGRPSCIRASEMPADGVCGPYTWAVLICSNLDRAGDCK